MLVPWHRISQQNLAEEHPSGLEDLKEGALVDICRYTMNVDNSAYLADRNKEQRRPRRTDANKVHSIFQRETFEHFHS